MNLTQKINKSSLKIQRKKTKFLIKNLANHLNLNQMSQERMKMNLLVCYLTIVCVLKQVLSQGRCPALRLSEYMYSFGKWICYAVLSVGVRGIYISRRVCGLIFHDYTESYLGF